MILGKVGMGKTRSALELCSRTDARLIVFQ